MSCHRLTFVRRHYLRTCGDGYISVENSHAFTLSSVIEAITGIRVRFVGDR